ncbi:hypothetical protein HID58_067480 [Brassica napus]|uniref:Uncharacterized protein n=1 Tax=Brassica napus TaxID=3708 RepID=A0ABQ7ZJ66_BRANA|nr:hypothetical protein HID58_067480 [Brassica napus]
MSGSRVISSRLRVAPTESMDSSDSSLDLTAKAKIPKLRASPAGGRRYPPIDPPSAIGAEEVAVWRKKYELPDDVVIRVPDPEDRVFDFGVDEVPVYEDIRNPRDFPRSVKPSYLEDINSSAEFG